MASDLKLMEIVTACFSPTMVQVSPLAATISIIFRELHNLATQFVENTKLDNTKKTKCVPDGHDPDDYLYSCPGSFSTAESLPHQSRISKTTGSVVYISFKCFPQASRLSIMQERN